MSVFCVKLMVLLYSSQMMGRGGKKQRKFETNLLKQVLRSSRIEAQIFRIAINVLVVKKHQLALKFESFPVNT